MTLICTKPKQVKAWIADCHSIMQFWQITVLNETYLSLGKTKEEAEALANYYEGKYDMAVQFTEILEEKGE